MYRILGIAPYEGFRGFFSHAVKQYEDVEASVYSASLEQAALLLQTLDMSRYDVIVCRGRTGTMVAESTDIPVVMVDFSAMDILRSLKLAQYSQHDQFAFVSFFDTRDTISFITELLDYPKTIHNPPPTKTIAEMEAQIDGLYAAGCHLFVGDGACTDYAKRLGADTILVTSGIESMNTALAQAVQICRYRESLRRQNTLYHNAVELGDLPVAIFDGQERLVHSNLFSHNGMADAHQYLKRLAPRVLGDGGLKTICGDSRHMWRVRGSTFPANGEQYALFYVLDAMPRTHKGVEVYRVSGEAEAREDMILVSNSKSLRNLWEKARPLADSRIPIMIYGGVGAGKTTFANALYAASPIRGNPLVSVDCSYLGEKQLSQLFEDECSPFFENDYTIFFNKVDTLGIALQNKLTYYLNDTALTSRNRVISSFSGNPLEVVNGGRFSGDLYYLLAGFPIFLPPLTERREDIAPIAGAFLGRINQDIPVQIVGFEAGAMELLEEYPWEYGIVQLKLALEQCVLAARGQLITLDNVRDVLSHMRSAERPQGAPAHPRLDLNKTLDEINRDIIRIVLQEENMNQSQAAKRLGISRGTIWKKMNG